ncbi:hypothetical protein E4U43_008407 [Claviceps pusilla]|uniref:BZIP domain-containing protein n=1 Tax=Claviceps pusilla TaxID=123648 RepID=A0A9P7NAR6_9HYPO|nr:hypothetical protein E4U43_008407 [Claviceps pusilla]
MHSEDRRVLKRLSERGQSRSVIDLPLPSVKITSQDITNTFSTQSSHPPARPSVELDFSSATDSIRSSSLTTANISALDFSVFTTDSQSTWPTNFDSSLPVTSAHPPQSPPDHQQDFVLFDSPRPCQVAPNPSPLLSSQRSHSRPHRKQIRLVRADAREAQASQALGQYTSSSDDFNRFMHQAYASSASSPSVTFHRLQGIHSTRPPVPLFDQSTGTVHQRKPANMMNAAGLSTKPPHSQITKPVCLHDMPDVPDVYLDEFTPFEGGASLFPSPAVSSVMDNLCDKSSSASTMGTISPHDLVHDSMSAPTSGALTALTTPSSIFDESPDIDVFGVSPLFGSHEFDASCDWPLFPRDSSYQKDTQLPESEVTSAEARDDKVSTTEPALAVDNLSTTINSPASRGARQSSVGRVNSRRRKPLSPIIAPDVNDITAMKRHRNTLAARKSRQRKVLHLAALEARIAELEAERDHWEAESHHWKSLALSQSAAQ